MITATPQSPSCAVQSSCRLLLFSLESAAFLSVKCVCAKYRAPTSRPPPGPERPFGFFFVNSVRLPFCKDLLQTVIAPVSSPQTLEAKPRPFASSQHSPPPKGGDFELVHTPFFPPPAALPVSCPPSPVCVTCLQGQSLLRSRLSLSIL